MKSRSNLTSSYSSVHLLVSWDLRILISLCLCVLVCILESLHLYIFRFVCPCLHPCILASSYPQVYVCLLVFSHRQVNVFSIQMNNCILASSSSLVLGNCASQFENNLQILRTRQAFVLDFYRTSKKIYWKQPLRVDLKKKLLLIYAKSLKNAGEGINFLEMLHPRKKSTSLLRTNSFTEIFQRLCVNLTNLLSFLKIPRLTIFQKNFWLLQIYHGNIFPWIYIYMAVN